MLSPNARVGHYQIRSLLGKGGMGEVYLAQDTTLKRLVAIKLLPPEVIESPARVRRFQREAYAASSLNHPNILTIYEIGEDSGNRFIASEYVEGESLRRRLERTQIPLKDILNIVIQAASALTAAEREGIVHRDIKPENIMLRNDGYVKVLDFGLAKLIEPKSDREGTEINDEAITFPLTETSPGLLLGTVLYMSPEQARGFDLDSRSDIWSLGVVFYEMLTNQTPFRGPTSSDVVAAILKIEPEPLDDFLPDDTRELTQIVAKMLHKDREERYQNFETLLLDLQDLKQMWQISQADRFTPSPVHSQREQSDRLANPATATDKNKPTQTHYFAETYSRISASKHFKLAAILTVITFFTSLAAAAYYGYLSQSRKTITSVAVLPFVNGTADETVDYLVDGVSESMLDSLSQVPQLKVINRTSSFKYKGSEVDPQQVAKALGVQALVMGRLVKRGDDLEVRVELIDGRDKTQIWGGQYRGKTVDLPAIQTQIYNKLQERLGFSSNHASTNASDGEEAYQFYLKGRYSWNKLTNDAVEQSISYFNQAIQKDPNYALAYAGLANAYLVLGANDFPPQDTYPKAEVAAKKALELDDTLAEAHYAMAATNFYYYWNYPETERELSRAIELNPNYSTAYNLRSSLRLAKGKTNEAITEAKRALDLDPLSLLSNNRLSTAYYYARDYPAALEQINKTMQIDSQATFLHNDLCMVYAQMGRYDDALGECQKSIILQKDDPASLTALAITQGLRGQPSEAEWILNTLKEIQKTKYVPPFYLASIYAALGNKDETFAWLNKAKTERSFIIFLGIDPIFDGIRSDARYAALVQDLQVQTQSTLKSRV